MPLICIKTQKLQKSYLFCDVFFELLIDGIHKEANTQLEYDETERMDCFF